MTSDDKAKQFADLIRQSVRSPGAGETVPVPTDTSAGQTAEVPSDGSSQQVADFVAKMKATQPAGGAGRGRLMFAMDATMSRQPTWDMALQLQGQMFDAVRDAGGLDVQLVYYRGYEECRHSRWVSDPQSLSRLMTQVACRGGRTQIGKVLSHARDECSNKRVDALVIVGDAFEEDLDGVCAIAGELSLFGVPVFMFQEGRNATAERAFREIARLTKGAWCRFDAGAAAQLRDLLRAVAVYAAGGRQALEMLTNNPSSGQGARLLLEQVPRSK